MPRAPLLVLVFVLSARTLQRKSCVDLPEEILEQMFGRLSVGVMSAFQHALQQEHLNLTCTRTVPAQRSRLPVNLLSVSPWAYRISYDPARYPRAVPEAYCLCRGCLLGPSGRETLQFRSAPVYAPSVLLQRTGSCIGGRHSYSEVYVSVPVGCTCVPLQEEHKGPARSRPRARQSLSPGKKP